MTGVTLNLDANAGMCSKAASSQAARPCAGTNFVGRNGCTGQMRKEGWRIILPAIRDGEAHGKGAVVFHSRPFSLKADA